MRVKWLLISAAAVVVGVGGGALSMHWKGRPAAPARNAAALIQTGSEITLSGKLRPQNVTTVKAEVDGDIDSFLVDVGEEVFEGQVLAHIGSSGLEGVRETATAAVTYAENQVSKAEIAVANARLESSRADADQQRARISLDRAQTTFERQRTIFQAGASPRLAWEKAQRDYNSAVQEFDIMDKAARLSAEQVQIALNTLSAAQKALADRTRQLDEAQAGMQAAEVRSTVSGLVVGRNGEAGKQAGPDLFQIATDMFALEVPLEPAPAVLQRLRPGQPALVLILDLQSAGIPGQIKEIKDNQVIVEFTSTLAAIRPGMRADVRLKLD